MTVLKSRTENKCGYIPKFWEQEPSVQQNIKLIKTQTSINGTQIKTVDVASFETNAVLVDSAYNPPKIRTLVTSHGNGHSLISNIKFGERQIQFICVDGNALSQYEFENPHTVINKVNNGQLKPLTFPDLGRLSRSDMTKIDAYAGSIWYCLFLWEVFGRVGIIDESHVYLSVVNVNMANAFWNSHYMTYGNGKEPGAPAMGPLTSIDVVGHESGHGIIEALGNLTYQGESGALNESIADIFGTCLEKYYDIRTSSKLFDWDLGEDFMTGGMRSLSNPKTHDQPDTYNGINWADPYGNFDNGGVHINSGVNNYFFYSLSTGASGQNDNGVPYHVKQAFQMFDVAKFIYNSLRGSPGYQKITSNMSYHQYADCLVSNCQHHAKTTGLNPNLIVSVLEALVAVGLKRPEDVPPPVPESEPVPPPPVPESEPVPPPVPESEPVPPPPESEPVPLPESEPVPPPPVPESEPVPPPPESEPVPPVPESEPVPPPPVPESEPVPPPPVSRQIVYSDNFVSLDSPFYPYGTSFKTSQGLLAYSGTQLVAVFDLSTLVKPQLHLNVSQGMNSLTVRIESGGRVYSKVQPVCFGETNLTVEIDGFDLSRVKINLIAGSSWWPSYSLFKSVAFSSLV